MKISCYPTYLKRRTKKPCPGCREVILAGLPCAKTVHKKGKFWFHTYWHFECWKKTKQMEMERLQQALWENIALYDGWFEDNSYHPKKQRKREVLSFDKEKRRGLMALYRYHRKRGNVKKMKELEERIKDVSCGHSPYSTADIS